VPLITQSHPLRAGLWENIGVRCVTQTQKTRAVGANPRPVFKEVTVSSLRRATLAILLTAVAASWAPVLAEDDVDEEIYWQFWDGKDRGVTQVTRLDMEKDDRGTLVVAMVERGGHHDAIIVAARDPITLQWKELAHFITATWADDRVIDLSLAVGSRLGEHEDEYAVFMAIAWDQCQGGSSQFCGRLDFYSGPVDRTWTREQMSGSVIGRCRTAPGFGVEGAMHPSVAVIPNVYGSYADYGVGIAWTADGEHPYEPSRVMLTVYNYYPGEGWNFATKEIAGPRARALQGSTFGHPSLATDLDNGFWAVALEDWSSYRVHLVRGRLTRGPSRPINDELLVFSTPSYGECSKPSLAIDRRDVTFTCLGDRHSEGGFSLEWFYGLLEDPDNFISGVPIHMRCRTPAVIGVNRDDAWITADCAIDDHGDAWGVFAFTGERDEPEMTVFTSERVSDHDAKPLQPRVAVETSMSGEPHAVYGYCTEDVVPYGSGPPPKAVFIDP
jgi:hypothetical protein